MGVEETKCKTLNLHPPIRRLLFLTVAIAMQMGTSWGLPLHLRRSARIGGPQLTFLTQLEKVLIPNWQMGVANIRVWG